MLELNTFGQAAKLSGNHGRGWPLFIRKSTSTKPSLSTASTALQTLIYAETCERGDEKGKQEKPDRGFGYGKGYQYALSVWQEFMEGIMALRSRSRHDDYSDCPFQDRALRRTPKPSSYSRYEIDLHEKARDLLKREVDVVLLLKSDVKSRRKSRVSANRVPALMAAGRSGCTPARVPPMRPATGYDLPERVLYERGKGFAALGLPIGGTAPAAADKAA